MPGADGRSGSCMDRYWPRVQGRSLKLGRRAGVHRTQLTPANSGIAKKSPNPVTRFSHLAPSGSSAGSTYRVQTRGHVCAPVLVAHEIGICCRQPAGPVREAPHHLHRHPRELARPPLPRGWPVLSVLETRNLMHGEFGDLAEAKPTARAEPIQTRPASPPRPRLRHLVSPSGEGEEETAEDGVPGKGCPLRPCHSDVT